MRIDIKFN